MGFFALTITQTTNRPMLTFSKRPAVFLTFSGTRESRVMPTSHLWRKRSPGIWLLSAGVKSMKCACRPLSYRWMSVVMVRMPVPGGRHVGFALPSAGI